MLVELNKEECAFISEAMRVGIEEANKEIASFDKDAKQEDVTATLVARSMMQMLQDKVSQQQTK